MDLSTAKWLSELEMDDPALINQWQMNCLDQLVNHDLSFKQFSTDHDHESCSTYQSSGAEYPPPEVCQTSILKPSNHLNNVKDSRLITISQKSSNSAPSSRIISFGNGKNFNSSAYISQEHYRKSENSVKTEFSDDCETIPLGSIDFSTSKTSPISFGEQHGELEYADPYKKGSCRTPFQAQDHVLAERKRREKLSQQFIALAAIVPGLKKLDKASVIGGAIKYLKQLEERIKKYEGEEQVDKKRKRREESAVSSERTRACYNYDDASSSGANSDGSLEQSPPEIEVRTSGGEVLLNVLCRKRSGIMVGFLSQLEKFHLSITSSSFMPFGEGMLLITAVAQMEDEFRMTAEDLANNIRQFILSLF